MEGTVTITLKEFENLKNGFENSKEKKELQKNIAYKEELIDELTDRINKIELGDFFTKRYSYYLSSTTYYFRKDKTPKWIRKLFN